MMQRVVSCHRRVAATAAGVWRTMGASVQLVDGSGVVMVSQPPAGTVMMTHRRGFAKAKKGMKGRPGQVSWSKRQQKKRAPFIFDTKYESLNHPKLVRAHIEYAAKIARKRGVTEQVDAFDQAAAGFEKPTPLVAATILERQPVLMRDLEGWEHDWLLFQRNHQEKYGKQYPDEFVDMLKAAAAKGDDGVVDDDGEQVVQKTTARTADGEFGRFYNLEEDDTEERNVGEDWEPLPRVTAADALDDKRSLDRALQERLVLLTKRKSDQQWVVPQTVVQPGEVMVEAAERGLKTAWGGRLSVWYPGNAPIGHKLQVNSPEEQERLGCYGSKIFYYRAIIIAGKLNLGDEYDDHRWLHRWEMKEYLSDEDHELFLDIVGGHRNVDFSEPEWKQARGKGIADLGVSQ